MALTLKYIGIYRVSIEAPDLHPLPDPSELGALVGLLDSENYDELYIKAVDDSDGERVLGLSGGRDGTVFLSVQEDPVHVYFLQRPDAAEFTHEVEITRGGTSTDVLERRLVPIDQAARALYYYLLTGNRDPALSWDQSDPPSGQ